MNNLQIGGTMRFFQQQINRMIKIATLIVLVFMVSSQVIINPPIIDPNPIILNPIVISPNIIGPIVLNPGNPIILNPDNPIILNPNNPVIIPYPNPFVIPDPNPIGPFVPTPFNNFNDPVFQNILNLIYQSYPYTLGYTLGNVQIQQINGFLYFIDFLTLQGCTIEYQIYVSPDGDQNIASYNWVPCSQYNSGGLVIQPFVIQPDPYGNAYQAALLQYLALYPYLYRSDLIIAQVILFSSGNYNFTFRNYVQPQNFIQNGGNGLNYIDITFNQSAIQIPLNLIQTQYPQVQSYFLTGIEQATSGGMTYYQAGFQDNTYDTITYLSFYITIDQFGDNTITQTCWIDSIALPDFWQLNTISSTVPTQIPQVNGYQLNAVSRVGKNQKGVKLTYSNGQNKYNVLYQNINGTIQTQLL